MRACLAILFLCAAAGAQAEKPPVDVPAPLPQDIPCNLGTVAYDWDFATDPHDFYIRDCDSGGIQAWEYGSTSIIGGAPARVWGTVLDGPYPNETGGGLVSPTFMVTPTSYLVEVHHYYETEQGYDGCNLVIYPYGSVWHPNGGYATTEISPSGSYYAWCVDGEPGWTGSSGGWRVDCFDLTDLMDYEIAVEFDFGSDASVNANGWYLARVVVGGPGPGEAVCCNPETGACTITVEEVCAAGGGVWHPEWTDCDPNPCPQPLVACCFDTGYCEMQTSLDCANAGGVDQGPGVDCDPNPCPQPEACCFLNGSCAFVLPLICGDMGGTAQGFGTDCDPNPCGTQAAACCFTDGSCAYVPEDECIAMEGAPQAPGSNCDPNPCPQPEACCYADGTCWFVVAETCIGYGGTPQGPGTVCVPNPCNPPLMACCFPDGHCEFLTELACIELEGVPRGPGTECEPNPCGPLEAPSNLLGETLGPDRIRLTWEDNALGEDGYLVERKDGPSGPWHEVHVLPGDVTTWEDMDVIDGEDYYYRVRACDGVVLSNFSNFVITIAGSIPAPPSNVVGAATSPISVDVTWTDNAWDEVGFEVERKEGEFGTWQWIGPNPPANAQAIVNTGAQPNTEYAYRVRAYNNFGHSAWAYSQSCYTPQDPGEFDATITVVKGLELIEGAVIHVARGSGFLSVGVTNNAGSLLVTDLSVGDSLRAVYVADHWYSCRIFRPWPDSGIHLWFDSDEVDANADYTPFIIPNAGTTFVLELQHPIFRYDLALTAEWDIDEYDPYWNQLKVGCQRASDYLYNVTDGQVALGNVALYDKKTLWDYTDVRILLSVHPNADVNGYYNCGTWGVADFIKMAKKWGDWTQTPDLADWYRTLIHEFGHYALDLKDEYINGHGSETEMNWLKTGPLKAYYPDNFGFMDRQYYVTEMSSSNDYLLNWDYDFFGGSSSVIKAHETKQLSSRGKPCWEHVEQKLENLSSLVDIRKPPWGYYYTDASTSADRTGPSTSIWEVGTYDYNSGDKAGPQVEVMIFDSGPGSFETDLRLVSGSGPAADAPVYLFSDRDWLFLGRTDHEGRIHAVGLQDGDRIRAYHRDRNRVSRGEWAVEPTDLAGLGRELVFPSAMGNTGPAFREEDLDGPGVALRVDPIGPIATPGIRLIIGSDEPVGDPPIAVSWIGARVDTLELEELPDNRFRTFVEIDRSDTLFSGTGLFEITLFDSLNNVSSFVAPFTLGIADPEDDLHAYEGMADFTVPPEDIYSEQLYLTVSSNAVPRRVPGFDLVPVTDMFSLHMDEDDEFPTGGSVNIHYSDSLLAGIDETSLVLCKWQYPESNWVIVEDGLVSTSANCISGPVDGGDLFCVYATELSNDVSPPGEMDDFGAVGVRGVGRVELLWTAPGDDGGAGTVQEYILAYADEPFTEEDWPAVSKMALATIPQSAGSSEQLTVRLTEPGHLYYLALKAKDDASLLSPMSNVTYVVSGTADGNFSPAPAGDFRAIDAPDDEGAVVQLNWDLSYDDGGGKMTVVAYNLYRNEPPSVLPETLATVPAGTDSYADSTVVMGRDYTYWISAVDAVSETMSPENHAFSAWNLGMPIGDFTSDAIVGINDLALMADTYASDAADPEFDPLFDLAQTDQIYAEDFELLASNFGAGGPPGTDPVGENTDTQIYRETVAGEGSIWHLNLTARNASNLAGYSVRVTYPYETLGFFDAAPDSAGAIENMLNRNGGATPLFLAYAPPAQPGMLWIANAIQRPSDWMAPDGDGFLAHLTFMGEGIEDVEVSDIVLMDHAKLLNYLSGATGIEDGTTILRPHLYWSAPNPFGTETLLRFQVPGRQAVQLKIHDVAGRLVRTVVNGYVDPGVHGAIWDGRSDRGRRVASGVYFMRFETDGYKKARKLVFIQ